MIGSVTMLEFLWLLAFWCMQAIAQIFFKWGSATPGRWLYGFFGGHAFGVSSIWLLMLLYRTMNPNVALGLGIGGGFLLAQVVVAALFHSRVSLLQCAGILAIAAGMLMLTAGGARPAS
jgi:multidrug transporter EmrE-like cation transporter